jgi:tripartite ATP-independent transporter DctM subunit
MDLAIALALVVLAVLNVPMAFVLILASFLFFVTQDRMTPIILVQRTVAEIESFVLLAVPFFILAGSLMNASGITDRLVRLAAALVGHLTGGLGQVNVVVSTLFGGLSGSGNADAAAEAKVLVPAMVSRGYSPAFASAVTAASAVITPLIPPSIGLILYGYLAEVSIGRLFLGGVIPGLIVTVAMMVVVYLVAKRRGYEVVGNRAFSGRELWLALKDASWALTIPIVIVGGIRFGVFTPTEAGAIAAAYTLVVGMFVYRELTWKDIPAALSETLRANGAVMLIIAAAAPFSWYLTYARIPQQVTEVMLSLTREPWLVLFIVNVFLLVVGTAMAESAMLIILVPLLVPVMAGLGVDLVHFGIVLTFNLLIGAISPPVGTLIYTTCSITRVSVTDISRELWPFIAVSILCLFLFTYVPDTVLFLPNLLMGP